MYFDQCFYVIQRSEGGGATEVIIYHYGGSSHRARLAVYVGFRV